MTKRFFAFGCSFTQYVWPTWADIIIKEFQNQGYEGYNYGMSGGGNYSILSNMMIADSIHKFTDNDVLMIVWSSWSREDKLVPWQLGANRNRWNQSGTILNSRIVNNEYLKKYWSLENDIIRNVSSIVAIEKLYDLAFEGNIPIVDHYHAERHTVKRNLYNTFSNLNFKNPFTDYDGSEKWFGHPTTVEHLNYIQNIIIPNSKTKFSISESTISWLENIWQEYNNTIDLTHNKQQNQNQGWAEFQKATNHIAWRRELYQNTLFNDNDKPITNIIWNNDKLLLDYMNYWVPDIMPPEDIFEK